MEVQHEIDTRLQARLNHADSAAKKRRQTLEGEWDLMGNRIKFTKNTNPHNRDHDHTHEHDHDHTHDHGHGHKHSHGHSHGHDHSHDKPDSLKALFVVLGFTATIFVAELVGGYLSGSLALISDAMHMLSDSTGLFVAAIAIMFARKAASAQATFGYRRIEVVAALLNAASVSVISIWIVVEAMMRLNQGEEINATMMLIVGGIGLVANIFGAIKLHGHSHDNMNIRGAYLHVLVDLFGSVAVIVAALAMLRFSVPWADTVASLVIAALILPRSLKLAWESLRVLLEQVPTGVDTEAIRDMLQNLDEVIDVHELHVWSLDGNELIATCHMVVETQVPAAGCDVLDRVQKALRAYGINHSTVQLETPDHHGHETTCLSWFARAAEIQ